MSVHRSRHIDLQGGKIRDARIGVGRAESFPRRIPEAEAALNGSGRLDAAFRAAAVDAAARAIDPLEDHQTNADYRRDLVARCCTTRSGAERRS